MKHRIGTTTHCDIESHCIEESITCCNITWQNTLITILIISISILHYLTSSILEELDTILVCCQDCTISWETQTNSLSQRVHRIGSEHTRTATTTRTSTLFYLLHLLIRNTGVSTLDHSCNQVSILTLPTTSFHRAARAEYSRNVQAHRCHEHTRSHLITIRDTNHGISLMSIDHILYRICDNVTAWQRVKHSVMTHSNTIIYSDGIKFGCIATHCLNFLLDYLTDFMKMSMTRHKLCKAIHNSNNWFAKLLMFHTCSYPKCTGTCHSSAFSTDATS